MGGIRTYGPYTLLNAVDASVNQSTSAVDFLSLPVGAIVAKWTGNPTGTFSIDGSIDNVSNSSGVTNWYPTGTIVNNPSGSADSTMINLNGIGFRWIRLSYTASSGAGTLTVTIFGKGSHSL